MQSSRLKILLIEDNPGDARLLRLFLDEAGGIAYDLAHLSRLAPALQSLETKAFDLALVDLSLPDSFGIETFRRVHDAAPETPIIVLTGSDDAVLAVEAVKTGAQDYLVKGQVDGHTLVRSIRYAMERHRLQLELRNQSLTDELTGLYNRRGFYMFVEQHLKLAIRSQRDLSVIFLDLDGMKQINDTWGHTTGDQALVDVADLLRGTFRESDIIARMGGDEFAIVALDTEEAQAQELCDRLEGCIVQFNAEHKCSYNLSVSMGVCPYGQNCPHSSADEMIAYADRAMYEQKRRKRERVNAGVV